jgi:uncharacterized SAM-binding protein YcdF (DUF218 family)
MFLMKKIVSRFFFPLPLSLEFLLVGVCLLLFTRRQRAGKALVTCGTSLLLVLSNFFTSNALLRPLERHYPELASDHSRVPHPNVTYIAVLGGFATTDRDVPISSRLSPDLLARLTEGVLLQREIPGSKLIVSGGAASAEGMTEVAEALGVRSEDIRRLSEPRDTEAESQQIEPFVGSGQFILVTSASHMPRAMGLFRKRGMQPIAAPTDFLAPRQKVEVDDFFPDGYKLFKSQVAFNEYLGLAWEALRGKL